MKKIILLCTVCLGFAAAQAQDFNKDLADARTAYAAGKLDDARFAMQQMLQELDIITGKEIMKLLPAKMQDQNANAANDNVSGSSGFVGVIVHRDYGADNKNIDVEVISNSPMITSINAILSMPLLGNMGDNKMVKIGGYKALVQKSSNGTNFDYEVQLPLNSTLITLKAPGYTQEQVIQMANSLPIAQIAKIAQ
ncbi:MAG: hypothetical protein INR73_20610 [Williamsia sp.]|nr:hypothetical protein [Williamsia sp.]